MEFDKHKLSDADMGYFITHLNILGQDRIMAAPEANGPVLAASVAWKTLLWLLTCDSFSFVS